MLNTSLVNRQPSKQSKQIFQAREQCTRWIYSFLSLFSSPLGIFVQVQRKISQNSDKITSSIILFLEETDIALVQYWKHIYWTALFDKPQKGFDCFVEKISKYSDGYLSKPTLARVHQQIPADYTLSGRESTSIYINIYFPHFKFNTAENTKACYFAQLTELKWSGTLPADIRNI